MRFTIRRKLALLTVLLGLMLVVSSVVISSVFYAASQRKKVRSSCRDAAKSMSSVMEVNEIDFLNKYKEKIRAVYAENREELEKIAAQTIRFDTLSERDAYFARLTEDIFPPRNGFGLSYEMAEFNNTYRNLLEEIGVVAYTNGLTRGCVWFYDAEYGNIVSLMDTSSDTSRMYDHPGSIAAAADERITAALKAGTETVFLSGEECHAVIPVRNEAGDPAVYIYYYLNNAGITSGVRLFALYTTGIMLAATIILSLVIMLFADKLIVRNIRRLSDAAETFTSEIGSGKPEKISAGVTPRDEIGDLSERFDLMQDTILGYIDSLAEKTSREEKMKAELSLAARIQTEALPKGRLKTGDVVLDSFIKPAREVGGDLYDYFLLDEEHLFFCLADVSGKGVPAALFMMRAKELIKAGVKAGKPLEAFARDVNLELLAGNDECQFITAFFGILDLTTRHLSFLRAGHEQPFLRRRNGIIRIGEESNYPLGLFDDAEFSADEVTLKAGDILLVFTDGLNEGINENEEAFGYERIEDVLKTARADTTAALFRALEAFRGTAEQFDDVTMLALSVADSLSLEFRDPSYEDIPGAEDAVAALLEGYDSARVSETGIIVDELMNNPISYGFAETAQPELSLTVRAAADEAELVFSDNGFPFDPLSLPPKSEAEKEEDHPPGGEGLALVRGLSSSLRYEYREGRNILTVRKDMRPSDEE